MNDVNLLDNSKTTDNVYEAFYIDYVNNFLTVAYMAEYYRLTEDTVIKLLNQGKRIHNSK